MWDTRVVEKMEEAVGYHSISVKFRQVSSGFLWAFSRVYGPTSGNARRELWEELSSVNNWWALPLGVGGG
jgi:hypothetical protein